MNAYTNDDRSLLADNGIDARDIDQWPLPARVGPLFRIQPPIARVTPKPDEDGCVDESELEIRAKQLEDECERALRSNAALSATAESLTRGIRLWRRIAVIAAIGLAIALVVR